jgi:hypothetical protein
MNERLETGFAWITIGAINLISKNSVGNFRYLPILEYEEEWMEEVDGGPLKYSIAG